MARYVLLLLLVAVVGAALAVPPTRYGDASEYVMATWSILHDGDLVYEEQDLIRGLALRPPETDIPAGLQLVLTPDGTYRFGGHTVYYPLLATPFCALLGYRGFYVLNALLLWLAAVALSRHYGSPGGLGLSLVGLFFSAAFCYVFWTTPENAIMCFLALSLFLWTRRRSFLSGINLGVAAAMKFPLALFAVALLAAGWDRPTWRGRSRFALGFLLLFLPQLAYNAVALRCIHATFLTPEDESTFMYFRSKVPYCEGFRPDKDVRVMHRWTSASNLSASRVVASVLDPSMGLVWFYPLTLYCIAMSRWRRRQVALVGALLLCLAVFCSVQRLSTHQVGLRALNYLYPALLFLPSTVRARGTIPRLLIGWAVLWGATFAVFPLANSTSQLERKPVPAYRLWAALRERADPRFFLERHRLAPCFAASNVYADGWTVGGRTAVIVCSVEADVEELELVVQAADKPWQRVVWRGEGSKGELVLRGGGRAELRIPIPGGVLLPRVVIEAEGYCPSGKALRSLGVRLLTVSADDTVLFESGSP